MKYKPIQRGNPARPGDPKKWYANAVNAGKFTIKDISKDIAARSSLTRGDIENVLNNFCEVLPVFLKLGMSVQLGEFGTMRLTLSCEGTDTPEEFNASKIKGVKVVFTPSVELKNELRDIKFEEVK